MGQEGDPPEGGGPEGQLPPQHGPQEILESFGIKMEDVAGMILPSLQPVIQEAVKSTVEATLQGVVNDLPNMLKGMVTQQVDQVAAEMVRQAAGGHPPPAGGGMPEGAAAGLGLRGAAGGGGQGDGAMAEAIKMKFMQSIMGGGGGGGDGGMDTLMKYMGYVTQFQMQNTNAELAHMNVFTAMMKASLSMGVTPEAAVAGLDAAAKELATQIKITTPAPGA